MRVRSRIDRRVSGGGGGGDDGTTVDSGGRVRHYAITAPVQRHTTAAVDRRT